MTLLLILSAFTNIAPLFASNPDKSQPLHFQEVLLTPAQTTQITKDAPFYDVDTDSQSAFILGRTSIWRWNFAKQKLGFFKMPQSFNDLTRHKKFSKTVDGFTVLGEHILGFLTANDSKWSKIDPLLPQNIRKILAFDKSKIVIATDGIYNLNPSTGVEKLEGLKIFTEIQSASEIQNNEIVIVGRFHAQDKLFLSSVNLSSYKIKSVEFKSQNPVIKIYNTPSQVFLVRANGIDILDKNLKPVKNIIVPESRSIIESSIDSTIQSYLFSDGLLEVFDNQNQKKYFANLGGQIKNSELYKLTPTHLVVTFKKSVKIFKLNSDNNLRDAQ